MKHLLLIREPYQGNDYTRGELYDADTNLFICYTLEDRLRNKHDEKVYGKTAIPFGNYNGFLRLSQNKGRVVPQLKNVENFTYVQIHAGNTIDDSFGCILVGYKRGKDKIWKSRKAERDLVKLIKNEGREFIIEIK